MKTIVISDLGSTKTKTVAIGNIDGRYSLKAISKHDTTVEAPSNDVIIGLENSIGEITQDKDFELYCTSSAGGGLQILVIGLTMFDSASSGKRAAYGAGGVILDTFALDDKRNAIQQMLDISKLHPDMILISGGTDGGAITGVLRLVEILRLAKPVPKFESKTKIPAIFAGNQEAAGLVQNLIGEDFELFILPNLRPSLDTENLKPSQEKIQELFMENVMEHAPGYSKLKKRVNAQIMPTPLAVLQTLQLLSQEHSKNIFAFDIGGATTDVFSCINGHFQRTVSANLGMSYSALNVMKEAGIEKLLELLPSRISEDELRNFIANKTLHPTITYDDTDAMMIEHALAKVALKMALKQHKDMHFNWNKIGYLDKLKAGDRDKYVDKFEYIEQENKYSFYASDIDILIGTGGVFTAVNNPKQAMMMLVEGIRPSCVTEIWIDKHFLSPHIGILSQSKPDAAKDLIKSDLISPIGLHIAPVFSQKLDSKAIVMEYLVDGKRDFITAGAFKYYEATGKDRIIRLKAAKNVFVGTGDEIVLKAGLCLLVDCRYEDELQAEQVNSSLDLYSPVIDAQGLLPMPSRLVSGNWTLDIELPYKGLISGMQGSKCEPMDVIASNPYDPPRLYIVQAVSGEKKPEARLTKESMLIKLGETIEADQLIFSPSASLTATGLKLNKFYSPVRGRVEYIEYNSGIVVLSEIQDYSSKPLTIEIAQLLNIKPKSMYRYMQKEKGSFVYRGEVLARRLEAGVNPLSSHIKAPNTGTITDIDTVKGTVTIQYLAKATDYRANVWGEISSVDSDRMLSISYQGERLDAVIGFGKASGGDLIVIGRDQDISLLALEAKVVFLSYSPDLNTLRAIAKQKAAAIVTEWINERDLAQYMNIEPGVINTGSEDIGSSILILKGFGAGNTDSDLIKNLHQRQGKHCYIDPHTRIRAGVIRPFACIQEKKT